MPDAAADAAKTALHLTLAVLDPPFLPVKEGLRRRLEAVGAVAFGLGLRVAGAGPE